MKITSTGIEFLDFSEFKRFVTDFDLLGSVSLSEPIIDKAGKILLKENVTIKENLIKKLDEMDGKFIPSFKLGMSRDLMKMLKNVLTKAVLARLEDRNNEFIRHLYEEKVDKMASLRGIIKNSFYSKTIALSFFRILLNHKDFFNYLADFGLITLGAVIQKNHSLRMSNRYSFLAGLCADICTSKDKLFKKTLIGGSLKLTAGLSIEIGKKLGVPEEVLTAINGHILAKFEVPDSEHATVVIEELRKDELNQDLLLGTPMEDESLNDNDESEPFSEAAEAIVLESLKIARFILENLKISTDKEHVSEKLLVMFTYNAEKGFFRKDLADPMIDRFTEFDATIKKIRLVAEIENKCKFPSSAWAYPKPKAAQVLCKDRNYHCPLIVNGWDLKIISPQDPYGFIGTTLAIGSYPKCALEEELQAKVSIDD